MWLCDEANCGRAVCNNCIIIPAQELGRLGAENVHFTCVSCHWKLCVRNDRPTYFVSALLFLFLFVFKSKYISLFIGLHNSWHAGSEQAP